jgi:hypothetical protein
MMMLENDSETLAEHSAGSRTTELQPEHQLGLRVTGVELARTLSSVHLGETRRSVSGRFLEGS